ncbi:MAG: hypothetical protein NTW19_09125 [Planctomycetota bacterium]|nr:hypothetical protein [Planctomycetota bacterium]
MRFLRGFLAWLKTNVVVVTSLTLCLISAAALYYIHVKGQEFRDTLAKRAATYSSITKPQKTPVELPPESPDKPPRPWTLTVNKRAIDEITRVFGRMNEEFISIRKFAVTMNAQNHLPPFMEGLFPEPSRTPFKAFEARIRYRRALMEMFEPYSPTAVYPQLHAKPALSPERIKEGLDREESDYLASMIIPKKVGELTIEEGEELQKKKANRLLKMLTEHAKLAHIYSATAINQGGFPFDVGGWTEPRPTRPSDLDLWEGQMTLWIVGDIARAIAQTNHVEDPNVHVLNAPIKRLIMARVVPGYIGGVPKQDPPNTPIKAQFGPSVPFGRVSNSLYDIRHVNLSMIVDWHRLPEFFDNLSQANFMCVLKMDIKDVDEYEQIKEGYFYGKGDAVQVDMLVETIWLRQWTTKLMPDEVKKSRGVPVVAAPVKAAPTPDAPAQPTDDPAATPAAPAGPNISDG